MAPIADVNMLRPLMIASSTAVVLVILRICHRFFSTPLSELPGPLAARLTSKWILLHGLCTNRSNLTQKLHERYGPIVRLAPNEISFSTASAINTIYGAASVCRKPKSYRKFGRTGIFHMQDPVLHKERRKQMGDTYSMKAALQCEGLIESRIKMLLQMIDGRFGQALDMLHWNRLMIVDMASGIFWGESFGAMEGADPPQLMACLDGAFLSWSLRYYAPLLHKLLTSLPIERLQRALNIDQFLYKSGQEATSAQIQMHGREGQQDTLLAKMLRGTPERGIGPMSEHDVAVEAANAIFAATETTSSTLAYAQYELARHPGWQTHLRDELKRAASESANNALDFKTLNALPILNGVVQETLRLHPACAYAPRLVPSDGAFIDGVVVPGGTIVSVSATVSQFNREVFPAPNVFDPQRWQCSNQAMRDMMMVWTKGVRICAGQNLALMEMKLAIARMIERYTVRLASDQTSRDMAAINVEEIMLPRGRKCMLVFDPIGSPGEPISTIPTPPGTENE